VLPSDGFLHELKIMVAALRVFQLRGNFESSL
jgi:hypothetical protein